MFGRLLKWFQLKMTSGERRFQTPHGRFSRWSDTADWNGVVKDGEKEVIFCAMDVEGQPYPQFIERIPDILRQLPSLEAAARKAVPKISTRHELDTVNGNRLDTDFSLVFYYEESEDVYSDSDSITVFFRDGWVVNWEQDIFNEEDESEEDAMPEDELEPPAFGSKPPSKNEPPGPWGSSSPSDGSNANPWS